jgi:hypothetical protein
VSSTDRSWTTQEVQTLRSKAHLGADTLADLLERPVGSVKMQAYRQRISLRRPGSRFGLVLGQPRTVSFAGAANGGRALAEYREAVVAGRVDPAAIERRARLLAEKAPLCPACVQAPIEVQSTGLCRACHLEQLADAHRLQEREAVKAREVDAAKQAKARTIRGRRRDGKSRQAARPACLDSGWMPHLGGSS